MWTEAQRKEINKLMGQRYKIRYGRTKAGTQPMFKLKDDGKKIDHWVMVMASGFVHITERHVVEKLTR